MFHLFLIKEYIKLKTYLCDSGCTKIVYFFLLGIFYGYNKLASLKKDELVLLTIAMIIFVISPNDTCETKEAIRTAFFKR